MLGIERQIFTIINQVLTNGLHHQKCLTFVKFVISHVYFTSLNIIAKRKWQLVAKIKLNIMIKHNGETYWLNVMAKHNG
jgi:hypothetical protein